MKGRAWHVALLKELSVRSWDESATQRGEGEGGENTHTLSQTKAYKCEDYTLKNFSVCMFQKRSNVF